MLSKIFGICFLTTPSHAKRSVEMDAVERANYESLAERNNHRISILQEGCSIRDDVLLNAVDLDFTTLRSLQRNISSNVRVDQKFRRTTENFDIQIKYREQLVDLFHVDEYGLMTCLPPKTGTTNWQRFFAALIYPDKKPEDFNVPEVFNQIPRMKDKSQRIIDQLDSRGDFTKLMNVRHPFARLLSAWHQKFHKNFHNLVKYVRQFGSKIEKYEDYNDEGENVYSFGAFLSYIANSASMQAYDYHWQTMSFQCMPCQIKYDVLTMQETSASDAVFLLEKKQLHGLTYLPGQYGDSPLLSTSLVDNYSNIPRSIIEKLYKIYYVDFLLFDYSIDEFLHVSEDDM